MPETLILKLLPEDNIRLANLCGQLDEHLQHIEKRLAIEISHRGHQFNLKGDEAAIKAAKLVLKNLYKASAEQIITTDNVHLYLQHSGIEANLRIDLPDEVPEIAIKTRRGMLKPRGRHQQEYLYKVATHDVNFGIGPAGTGKTYLAVACAVDAMQRDQVRRILLVRPAVEAGEKLGFLPGDLSQKIDPYLRPLYDALYEMLGFERVAKLIERNVIEVAPLAYMRGRTLNESFIILDEAQNTTPEQMKMFLTRIGFGSTAVITGDITQIDLPRGQACGLKEAAKILADVDGISFTHFEATDVVRHQLVQRIVQAYDKAGEAS